MRIRKKKHSTLITLYANAFFSVTFFFLFLLMARRLLPIRLRARTILRKQSNNNAKSHRHPKINAQNRNTPPG